MTVTRALPLSLLRCACISDLVYIVSMSVCVYVYVCVCVCLCVCVCIYIYIYMYVCMCVCMFVCVRPSRSQRRERAESQLRNMMRAHERVAASTNAAVRTYKRFVEYATGILLFVVCISLFVCLCVHYFYGMLTVAGTVQCNNVASENSQDRFRSNGRANESGGMF